MKPVATAVRTAGNLTGPARTMALDSNALGKIMKILTDIYPDPIKAAIREYATNAFDATVEAGSNEPIRITLPTDYSPAFVVQDYGVGMSPDTLLDHYSLYGRSDKADSNAVVGMLGIGCKSALTYTDSFSVVSRRDGVETVASIAKNSDGIGEVHIMDTRSTTERNGTTITIPVSAHDIRLFREKAEELFGYWDAGTVLVNGKAPVSVFADGYTQIPGTQVWQKSGYGEHILLMGNVPYIAKSPILNDFAGSQLIIKADIGSVEFAPSREELTYNDVTNKFLRDITKGIQDAIQAEVDGILANAKSGADAFEAFHKFGKYRFMKNVKWAFGGKGIPTTLSDTSGSSIYWENRYDDVSTKAKYSWRLWSYDAVAVITGWKGQSVPEYVKKGLIAKSKDDKHPLFGKQNFILVRDGHTPDFLEWVNVTMDWSVLSADIPKPAAGSGNGGGGARTNRSGRKIDSMGYSTTDSTLDPKGKFIIVSPKDFTDGDRYLPGKPSVTYSQAIRAGFTPVLVYVRDQAAFREEYTVATNQDVLDWLTEQRKNIPDSWYIDTAVDRSYNWIRGKKIDDPDLAPYVNSKKPAALSVDYDEKKLEAANRALHLAIAPYSKFVNSWSYNDATTKSYVEVMNALYNYRKDQKNG